VGFDSGYDGTRLTGLVARLDIVRAASLQQTGADTVGSRKKSNINKRATAAQMPS